MVLITAVKAYHPIFLYFHCIVVCWCNFTIVFVQGNRVLTPILDSVLLPTSAPLLILPGRIRKVCRLRGSYLEDGDLKVRLRRDSHLLSKALHCFKYLKGRHTEEGQDLFLVIPECRTRNNGLKLKEARFWLNIRKNILTVRAVRHWNQFPRELVSSPTLEAFK